MPYAGEVRRTSYCVLRAHLDRALLGAWSEAFAPLLDANVRANRVARISARSAATSHCRFAGCSRIRASRSIRRFSRSATASSGRTWSCASSPSHGRSSPDVVIGFSRRWLRRPEVAVRVPESTWSALDEAQRKLLRFEPVVPDGRAEAPAEVYAAFAY